MSKYPYIIKDQNGVEWVSRDNIDFRAVKNPDSEEETGVDEDAVWETVLDAMEAAYESGRYDNNEEFEYPSPELKRDNMRNILIDYLSHLSTDDCTESPDTDDYSSPSVPLYDLRA